jgi:tetratricopeptide (TPR) repeat protein
MRWLSAMTLIAVVLWLLRSTVTGSLAGEASAPYFLGISGPDRILAALGVLPRALALLVMPIQLGFEYGPPAIPVDGRFGWTQTLGVVMILTWCVALWQLRVRRPVAAFGLWWAAITWLPASSLVVPAGLLLADRVLFLPTIGLALAVSSLRWPEAVRWSRLATATVAVVVCLLAVRSRERLGVWRDANTFFSAMTRDNPNSYRAWYVRAMHEKSLQREVEAEAHLRRALELWPWVPTVHEELGQLLRADGRCEEAIPIFREGLALDTARFQLRAKLVECERVVGSGPPAGDGS